MSVSQADKAKKFRDLHEAPGAFVIANPWDGGSARLLAGLGFQALATSSGAKAGVLGKRDGKVTREEALANASGVSRSMLSQIEREQANPTLAVTLRIARAFGLSLGELLELPGAASAVTVIRADDHAYHYRSDKNVQIRTLSPLNLEKDVELYEVRLQTGGSLCFRQRQPKAITKGGIDMIESEATTKGRRDFLKSVALGSAAFTGAGSALLGNFDTSGLGVSRAHAEGTRYKMAFIQWQPHTVPAAIEQRHAQLFLERMHLLAHRRLAQIQPL